MDKIKIMIVDDNVFYRQALITSMAHYKNIEVVSEAQTGKEFLNKYNDINPDVIVMDVKMPEMDGIRATKIAMNERSDLKIIGLTMFKDKEYVAGMIEAGAKGILFKDCDHFDWDDICEAVIAGEYYFSKNIHELF